MSKELSSAAGAAPVASKQSVSSATYIVKTLENGWHALNYALQYVPEGDILRPKMLLNLKALAAAKEKAASLPETLEAVSEFLGQQADAEYHTDSASPTPNEAMRLQIEVDALLARATEG